MAARRRRAFAVRLGCGARTPLEERRMDREPSGSRAAGAGERAGHEGGWRRWLIHEARRTLFILLYLYVMFGLFLLHESVVLARYNIPFTRYGYALFTAIVLAKVMLVMEDFHVANRFKTKPLIYSILYKSVVCAVVFLVFYIGEETIAGLIRGKTLFASFPEIGGGTPLGFAVALVIVSLALVPYFAFKEMGEALGEGKLRAVLFTRPRPAKGAGAAMPG
jgi:hypothetical protein